MIVCASLVIYDFAWSNTKFKYLISRLYFIQSTYWQRMRNSAMDFKDFTRRSRAGIVLICIMLWCLLGFFVVQLNEEAAILRFGKLNRIYGPGLHWHIPWPFENPRIVDVTSLHKISIADMKDNSQDPNEDVLVLTNDENMLLVQFTIFWKVKDLANYLFRAKSPDSIIESAAEAVMREIMSKTKAQDALTIGRQAIADQIKARLQELVDEYRIGIEVVDAQMGKIDPPESVIDAYRDVLKAKLEQETQKNEAESYANYVVPKAEGKAFQINSAARAEEARIIAEAEGEARSAKALHDVFSLHPDLTKYILYNRTVARLLSRASKVRIFGTKMHPMIHMLDKQEVK